MSPDDFAEGIKRLSLFFTPVDDTQMDVLWSLFKEQPGQVWRMAVKALLNQHPYQRFPLPREIWVAIRAVEGAVRQDMAAKELAEHKPCKKCGDTSWMMETRVENGIERTLAVFCTCDLGQRRMAKVKAAARAPLGPPEPALEYPHLEAPTPKSGKVGEAFASQGDDSRALPEHGGAE